MSTPQKIQPSGFEEQENDLVPIVMKWLGYARRFWYWIILSAIVCLIIGFIYQQRQARVYSTKAVILIEQKDGGGTTMRTKAGNSQVNTLMQLNGITAGDNMKNEMFILSSLRLMRMVVPILSLDVDYTTKVRLHEEALYRDRPFRVNFDRPAKWPASMTAKINDDGSVTLSNFAVHSGKHSLSSAEAEQEMQVKLGQKVRTPIGVLSLTKDVAFKTFERGKEVRVTHYTTDAAAARYQRMVSATELEKDCDLIVLSCNDINRDRACDILYAIVDVYKQDVINNKNSESERTAEFIDGRLKLISSELAAVESEFASFKAANNITDLNATASAMTQQSLQAQNATTRLSTDLSVAQYLEEYLRTTPGAKDVIPVISNFGNSAVSAQIAEFNRLVLNRNRLASNSSEASPAVREQDRQLDQLRTAINSSLASYVKSLELELRAARANEAHYLGQAGQVPAKEKRVIDIARQQSMKEALYTYLLNKREEVALRLAIEEANVRIVEDPASSSGPISPRTRVILLISLLIGIAIPFGLLYIKEMFDTTVNNRREVEDALSAPIVGELPHVSHCDDHLMVYGPGADLTAPIAEAFRLLRYGMHYVNNEAKVFLVTSSSPSHGKSFVSRNLAAAIAMTQKKVLLMDADIRVRNLTRNHKAHSLPGITEYLIGDVEKASDIIIKDGIIEGVDFMPAGITPPNTTEMLMKPSLDKLVAEMRELYDVIILDTTPAFAVADASIVSRVSDLTLFVVRVGEQVRAGLPAIEELYKNKKCGNMAIVVNEADAKTRTYGYGYGGYSGYSYSYQYGYDVHRHRKWWEFWKESKHKK